MPYIFNPFTGALDDTVPLTGGKIPASYLPSYVDDVEEYANLAAFPVTGETGKIYLALDTNTIYRWGGSVYTIVGSNVTSINDLSDVDTSTAVPTTDQVLVWNGSNFVPETTVLSKPAGITGATVITNCVQLSQANYDAISAPDSSTLYVIV